jgi:monoamine oxidase
LMDRVVGVIPGRFIRTQHELVEVNEYGSGFELKFQTGEGIKTVVANRVICTLPFSILRHIKGIQKISFGDSTQKYISEMKYGQQAKGVLSFNERPWKKTMEISRFSGDFDSQNFWESEPRSGKEAFTQRSLLTFQLGGKAAKGAGLHSVEQALKDLNALKLAGGYEGLGQVHNWSQHRWSQGGVSFFGPQQTGEYAGLLSDPHCLGRWYFAGEHTSLQWPGTINGAIESAQMATNKVSRAPA